MTGWIIAGGVALWGYLIADGIRKGRAAKRRCVCPVCGGRDLTEVNSYRWSGNVGMWGMCTVYRCDGCHEELFAELDNAPMTRAEHEAWLDAMHERALSLSSGRNPDVMPEARLRAPRSWRRWWSR